MRLKDIVKGIQAILIGTDNIEIDNIQFDSRRVGEGSLFVAQKGTQTDGHRYIKAAIERGAKAIICQDLPSETVDGVSYLQVDNSDEALGLAASNFYSHPSEKLSLIGITGTNGKTTTVTLLHRLFRRLGYHVGLLSTIVNKIDEAELPAHHTTPDAIELNALLEQMVKSGCTYCFMEVSSHAVQQRRIAGLHFAGGIFSNITHDHLDFHKTMAAYIAAKQSFFSGLPSDGWALTNADDRNGHVMVQNCPARIYTYALQHTADFHCKVLEDTFEGMHLEIDDSELWCRLVGRFNAYNLTAIYGAARLCGVDKQKALQLMSTLEAAPGRFQYVAGHGITGIVDYAHTPDALQNVIETINTIRRSSQHLITVVGCGGDRDRTKRPEMARIAVEGSDKVVFTSDNPRSERPEDILDDMENGLDDRQRAYVIRITDRRQAIRAAVKMAREGDIVLVAGKGHETYQEVCGVRSHFDDVEELSSLLLS